MSDKEPPNKNIPDEAPKPPDVEVLKKENEHLKSENDRMRGENEGMKARLEKALADLSVTETARDKFREGFEHQQKAHEEAMKAIERRMVQNKLFMRMQQGVLREGHYQQTLRQTSSSALRWPRNSS